VANPRHQAQRIQPSGSRTSYQALFDRPAGQLSCGECCHASASGTRMKQWIRLATPNRVCGVVHVVKIFCHAALFCPRASTTSGNASTMSRITMPPKAKSEGKQTHMFADPNTCSCYNPLASVYCIGALAGNTFPPPPHRLSRIEYGTIADSTLQTCSDGEPSLIGRVYSRCRETAIKRTGSPSSTKHFPSQTVSTHATVKLPKFRKSRLSKG
jgi:hypothetical protein